MTGPEHFAPTAQRLIANLRPKEHPMTSARQPGPHDPLPARSGRNPMNYLNPHTHNLDEFQADPPVTADSVVALGRLALKFGEVNRITYHDDGTTPESDTTHTVMLGLVACAFAAAHLPHLDLGLIAQYAFVHDLVEAYAGDTPTLRAMTPDAKADKQRREHEAYLRIAEEFAMTLPWVPELIAQYEARDTAEARYVKALDKLLPKITHIVNDLATIREQGMTLEALAARYDDQFRELRGYAADFPALFELRADLVGRVMASYLEPAPTRVPCPDGFHWVGQSFATCHGCGLPAWDHAGMAVLPKDAGPFAVDGFVLEPWRPGEAEACRAKWDPACRVQPAESHGDGLTHTAPSTRVSEVPWRGEAGADGASESRPDPAETAEATR